MLAACTTHTQMEDGEHLYVGMEKIKYQNYEDNDHARATQVELEAAMAAAPNGALFGSSYHRSPFPYSLWIYNTYAHRNSGFAKWMTKNFGNPPVLISNVNPELRSTVAKSLLRNNGYFHGDVNYKIITQKDSSKAKIAYTVDMGRLYRFDSIAYVGFPEIADSMIYATWDKRLIHRDDPFSVSKLDAERTRISEMFRNNGYYYFQPSYAHFLADTMQVPGKVQTRIQLADSLPAEATRQWRISGVKLRLRRQNREQLTDSVYFRRVAIAYAGKKPPIRARVIFADLKLRPNQLYSYDDYMESVNKLSSMGIFSYIDFKFKAYPDSIVMKYDSTFVSTMPGKMGLTVDCVLDKPYDFYIQGGGTVKTNGKLGPELTVGLIKRNAFRGGEQLKIDLVGSIEWQTSGSRSSIVNSYEYGVDASLKMPRLLLPWKQKRRRRWYTTPSTTINASARIINRADFFRRNSFAGDITYTFQRKETVVHQLSPLSLKYEYMASTTEEFDKTINKSTYLKHSMEDMFVPKIVYTFQYSSPRRYRNPIDLSVTLSESGNLISLANLAFGKKWSDKGKKLLSNPYSQFVKLEADWTKTWTLGDATLVGHVAGGLMYSYGNSEAAPYSEQFYVGGANCLRAWPIRSIGPGNYTPETVDGSYYDQVGDSKFVFSLELRPHLFGSLYGALFLDGGNIWTTRQRDGIEGGTFQLKNLFKDMALCAGLGLRYDLDYFVIRLDWGMGMHVPYRSGFFNVQNFKDNQSINLAIGYPF